MKDFLNGSAKTFITSKTEKLQALLIKQRPIYKNYYQEKNLDIHISILQLVSLIINLLGDELKGRVVFEIFYDKCPKTCDNFLSICKGFKNNKDEIISYEKSSIHRIVKNSYIQGGDLLSGIYYYLII